MATKKELKIVVDGEEVYIQLFEEKTSLSEMVKGVVDNFKAMERKFQQKVADEEAEEEEEEERDIIGHTEAEYEYMKSWSADSMEEAFARENDAER